MGELYLAYASFVYYVVEVYKYKDLNKNGKEHISFYCDGKMFSVSVYFDDPHSECGYVYTNREDLKTIFKENANLAKDLEQKCVKRKGSLLPGEKDWHCHIPDALKGHINIKHNSLEKAICTHDPVPQR